MVSQHGVPAIFVDQQRQDIAGRCLRAGQFLVEPFEKLKQRIFREVDVVPREVDLRRGLSQGIPFQAVRLVQPIEPHRILQAQFANAGRQSAQCGGSEFL